MSQGKISLYNTLFSPFSFFSCNKDYNTITSDDHCQKSFFEVEYMETKTECFSIIFQTAIANIAPVRLAFSAFKRGERADKVKAMREKQHREHEIPQAGSANKRRTQRLVRRRKTENRKEQKKRPLSILLLEFFHSFFS